ncbi:SAM-dependent methyltransferase, partial [Acinetobacter baumannii]
MAFGIGPNVLSAADVPAHLAVSPDGSILEIAPAAFSIMEALAARIARSGLGLIAIDYGYATASVGDSFQAVRLHKPVDPLARPG